eukprot:TRINITY_DN48293_c0_g1_i1.p2 TRINITY_DN48293_c0_g1~~TRINITY_DN48293_c0_g1_i1.p2  ORF type:complete len:151 (+),score=25.87 TRINITY_DN48293_c0_g1_i1:87-539(+)
MPSNMFRASRGVRLLSLVALVGLLMSVPAFLGGSPVWRRSTLAARAAEAVTPLRNQVLVEEIEREEETAGGLIVAGGKKKNDVRLRLGRVKACGPGSLGDLREKTLVGALSEGDEVLFEDFSNRRLSESDEDDKLFLVPVGSIKAKVAAK